LEKYVIRCLIWLVLAWTRRNVRDETDIGIVIGKSKPDENDDEVRRHCCMQKRWRHRVRLLPCSYP